MNIMFRIMLTLNATLLLPIVFLVQKNYTLNDFFQSNNGFITFVLQTVTYLCYFSIPLILTGFCLWLSARLGKDEFKLGDVVCIEYANNAFLPSYLGYFFVALSINNWATLSFIYGVLFTFTFFSQALYFNPFFLIIGYKFYNIKTQNGASIFLISSHRYKTPHEIAIPITYRINDYTFLEKKGNNNE